MIAGTVTEDLDVVVPLDLLGASRSALRVEAVVDSGFNGFLTLSAALVERLRLRLVGNRRAALADGSVVVLDLFLGEVLWDGQEREILVLQAEGAPLVGMALLYGSQVLFDVIEGGAVRITPLS